MGLTHLKLTHQETATEPHALGNRILNQKQQLPLQEQWEEERPTSPLDRFHIILKFKIINLKIKNKVPRKRPRSPKVEK